MKYITYKKRFMYPTHLYVELIVIGIETTVWMCMVYINIVGNKILDIISQILNNLASSILLIGLYIDMPKNYKPILDIMGTRKRNVKGEKLCRQRERKYFLEQVLI